MKSELADQIGLTEKQISSWFCHRRLKDKRLKDEGYTNGRQDRSSSILQDRGSGLRQDSCGSTKQGDYRNIDPKEVESQRLHGQDFHTADLTYDRTSRYTGNVSGIDNISSRSSSSLQDKLVSQREDPYDTETSKYLAQNGASMPLIPKGAESFGHKPSGYLKVKGEIENAAITAVKIQLGRHYKENGPPLGVEFQLLPPSAFASPSRDPVNGPIYVGDLGRMHSPDVSGVRKQPGLSGVHAGNLHVLHLSIIPKEVDIPCSTPLWLSLYFCGHFPTNYALPAITLATYFLPHFGGVNCNPKHVSDSHERKSRHHLEQKSTYNGSNSNAGGNSAMDMPDDLAGEMRVYKNKRNYRTSSKHDFEGKRADSLATHHGPSGRRVNNEKTEAWLHDHDNDNPKIAQRNDYMSKPSHLIHGPGKSLVTEERAPFIMTEKDEKRHGEMKKMKGSHDSVRVKRHPRDETVVAKRFRTDFSQQEHVTKASVPGMRQRTNLTESGLLWCGLHHHLCSDAVVVICIVKRGYPVYEFSETYHEYLFESSLVRNTDFALFTCHVKSDWVHMFEVRFKVQAMLGVGVCTGGCRMPGFVEMLTCLSWRGHLVSARMNLQKPVLQQNEDLTIDGFGWHMGLQDPFSNGSSSNDVPQYFFVKADGSKTTVKLFSGDD
ncbi:hypothetical protein DKX38_024888 [Salix brachista]|uniref:Homeobox domain-containing protein n=1 Tax=Salix brachista TaxID=2182728 RepID=A0A5N5JMV5_9ROSI|nr:hypothetical protein DKX38_024888 [Salix brachista]